MIKLAPQNLISSARLAFDDQRPQLVAPSSEPLTSAAHSEAGANQPLALHATHDSGNSNGNSPHNQSGRKPAGQQLPVANSHLKKPASVASEPADETSTGGGAKSLVSPTILLDAPATNDDKQLKTKKANGQQPPDVWEPNQVMSGVSNVSLVPAVINRDYGSQTRTRVTLGGGYQRDRQPAPEEPAASKLAGSGTGSKLDSGSGAFSHLVEVPERIVLPASVLTSQQPARQPTHKQPTIVAAASTSNASLVSPPGRQQKLDPRCPKQGVVTFEHPIACDKFFFCEDGYLSEQTCPNGLLYGTRDTVRDYCVHRWKATCEDKVIPNPVSSPGCRWQFGIFSVQGSPKCTPDFYECIEGRFEVRKCSIDGQVYDDRTKSCQYSEAVGCAQETLGDFQCPADDQGNTYWPFPRYFLNERALIHCVNDKPEIVRCTSEERVDPEHLHCVPIGKLQPKSHGSVLDVPVERRARERKKEQAGPSGSR